MTKVSDILKIAGLDASYESIALKALKNSSEYKNKISYGGITGYPVIDGDPNVIASFIKNEIDKKNKNQKYYDIIGSDNVDQTDYEKLLESIPEGNSIYEYKTIIIKDSDVLGIVDAEGIERTLNRYALEGWRLRAAITNEIGHNRAVIANATINNTILILERLVVK